MIFRNAKKNTHLLTTTKEVSTPRLPTGINGTHPPAPSLRQKGRGERPWCQLVTPPLLDLREGEGGRGESSGRI